MSNTPDEKEKKSMSLKLVPDPGYLLVEEIPNEAFKVESTVDLLPQEIARLEAEQNDNLIRARVVDLGEGAPKRFQQDMIVLFSHQFGLPVLRGRAGKPKLHLIKWDNVIGRMIEVEDTPTQ